MATFLTDSFTGTDGTNLEAHTGETGATWASHPSYTASAKLTTNRVQGNGALRGYYSSGVPAAADYDVECSVFIKTHAAAASLTGRMSTSVDTMYRAQVGTDGTNTLVTLIKRVAGVDTTLGSAYNTGKADGSTFTVRLQMRGTTIKVFVDGVERISQTDSDITSAGRAGLRINSASTTGYHYDLITALDPPSVSVADSATPSDAQVKSPVSKPADSLTLADAQAKTPHPRLADSASLSDAVRDAVALALSDTTTPTDAQGRTAAFLRGLADTSAATDAASRAVALGQADAASVADAVGLSPTLVLLDALTPTDASERGLGKAVADTAALADAVQDALALSLADAVPATDAQAREWVALLSLAEVIAPADVFAKGIGLAEADAATPSDALRRGIVLGHAEALVVSDSQARAWAAARALTDALGLADSAVERHHVHLPPRGTIGVPRAGRTATPPPRFGVRITGRPRYGPPIP